MNKYYLTRFLTTRVYPACLSIGLLVYIISFHVVLSLVFYHVASPLHDYQTGNATYYTVQSSSNKTASGELYNEEGMTCALRTHKFGHIWRVCRLDSDICVVVRNNDYGPGNSEALIDLTPKAFSRLAPLRDGIIKVSVRRIR